MFWHCVFSSWQPFLLVGFCHGMRTTGKQTWRLSEKRVCLFSENILITHPRQWMTRGYNICTLQLQRWANVKRGLRPGLCLWESVGLCSNRELIKEVEPFTYLGKVIDIISKAWAEEHLGPTDALQQNFTSSVQMSRQSCSIALRPGEKPKWCRRR